MSLVKDFESPHLDVRRVPGLGGMAGRNCVEISSHDSFKITMENNHVLLQKYGQWRKLLNRVYCVRRFHSQATARTDLEMSMSFQK